MNDRLVKSTAIRYVNFSPTNVADFKFNYFWPSSTVHVARTCRGVEGMRAGVTADRRRRQ